MNNLAPAVLSAGDLIGLEGQLLSFTGAFVDAGIRDTHTAIIFWGDGSSSMGSVSESSGAGSVAATHSYADNGSYSIRLEVTDNDGASGIQLATATVGNVCALRHTGGQPHGNPGRNCHASTRHV